MGNPQTSAFVFILKHYFTKVVTICLLWMSCITLVQAQDTIYTLKPPFRFIGEVLNITPFEVVYRSKNHHKIQSRSTKAVRFINNAEGEHLRPNKINFNTQYKVDLDTPPDTIFFIDNRLRKKTGYICDETLRFLVIANYSNNQLQFTNLYKGDILVVLHSSQGYSHPKGLDNYVSREDQINKHGVTGLDTVYFKSNPLAGIPCTIIGYNVDKYETQTELEFETRTLKSRRNFRAKLNDLYRVVDGGDSLLLSRLTEKDQKLQNPFKKRTFFSRSDWPDEKDYPRNSIYIDPFAFASNTIHIGYERIIGNGHLGLRIPVRLGLSDNSSLGEEIFSFDKNGNEFLIGNVGMDLLVYPENQYFIGPIFGFGAGMQATEANEVFYETDKNGYQIQGTKSTERVPREYAFVKTYVGLSFNLLKRFNITPLGHIGVKSRTNESLKLNLFGAVEFNLKYQF